MPQCRKRSSTSSTGSEGQTSSSSSVYMLKAPTMNERRPEYSTLCLFSGSSDRGCLLLEEWEQRITSNVCFPQLWCALGLDYPYPGALGLCPLPDYLPFHLEKGRVRLPHVMFYSIGGLPMLLHIGYAWNGVPLKQAMQCTRFVASTHTTKWSYLKWKISWPLNVRKEKW